MSELEPIRYAIQYSGELNLCYIPFLKDGGLFIPTTNQYALGDEVVVHLEIPAKQENLNISGEVVWITPKNALHHVLPGIGIKFTGVNAKTNRAAIEKLIDPTMEVGGYTYGIMEEASKKNK